MIPRILEKNALNDFAAALLESQRLVGPVCKEPQWDQSSPKVRAGGLYAYQEVSSPDELAIPFPHTILSPKKFAYPQYDTLLRFNGADASPAEVDLTPTVIFGAHPCDIQGLATSDVAMCSDNADPYYAKRRECLTIIGLDCPTPCDEFQFCRDMGSVPCNGGYDLFLVPLEDRYYVEVGSEKGKALVENSDLFRPAESADHHAREAYSEAQLAAFPKKIPVDVKYLPEILGDSHDSLLWEAASRNCFSCGTCTNVCPTCYCFDVVDDVELADLTGTRNRKWDSCTLKIFATVADGHNFRATPADRLKHRVMRKGKYILERFGKMGCTGCGRCDRHCVAGISILQVYQMLTEGAAVAD